MKSCLPPKALPKPLDILQIKIQHFTVPSRWKKPKKQKTKGIFTQMKSLFPTAAITVSELTKCLSER